MRDYKLTLNLVTNEAPGSKIFKQYDTGNEIELELYQNEHLNADEKLVLTDESVLAFFKRQDGQVLQKNCTVRNGNVIVTTSKDVLGVPGVLELECLVKKGDVETTTTRMTFTVQESIARDGAIEEDPRYTSDLVTELLDVRDNVKAETIGKIEEVASQLEEKVNKEQGKGLSTNDYTTDEKNKLSNIEERANAYVHPLNHSATIITQDSTHRFITDIERDRWNNTFNHASDCEVLTTKEGTKIGFQHGYITTDGNEYWKTVTFPNAFKDIYYSAFVSPFYKTAFGSVSASDFTPLNMKVCAESGVMYVYWLAIGELAE